MIHRLKRWTPFFCDIVSGAKTLDVRKDDRGFAVGDQVDLVEVGVGAACPESGRTFRTLIVYILRAGEIPGEPLKEGWVVLGLRR